MAAVRMGVSSRSGIVTKIFRALLSSNNSEVTDPGATKGVART
jgi:hypothetical protein